MLAMASSLRSPASSISPREGWARSSKWSGHSSSIFISRSKSSSFAWVSSITNSRSSSVGASGGCRSSDSGLLGRSLRLLLHDLQHRVLFHLLLDPLLQGQDRQLQNLHRLDHPRRQHLLLHQSEVLAEGESHG